MLDKRIIKQYLKKKRPLPKSKWFGEPNLGSYYDQREINSVIKVLKQSRHFSWIWYRPKVDKFDKILQNCEQIMQLQFQITVMALICSKNLNLKKGDEIIAPALNFKHGTWYC